MGPEGPLKNFRKCDTQANTCINNTEFQEGAV